MSDETELLRLKSDLNKFELLAEDLEALNMCLDDLGAPTHDKSGENKYSEIGRVNALVDDLKAQLKKSNENYERLKQKLGYYF